MSGMRGKNDNLVHDPAGTYLTIAKHNF